jgi:hypothetical protein
MDKEERGTRTGPWGIHFKGQTYDLKSMVERSVNGFQPLLFVPCKTPTRGVRVGPVTCI